MANVMVVDDALFMRMTIKKMLEAHGHTVVGEAGNGVEAVKRYARQSSKSVLFFFALPFAFLARLPLLLVGLLSLLRHGMRQGLLSSVQAALPHIAL